MYIRFCNTMHFETGFVKDLILNIYKNKKNL